MSDDFYRAFEERLRGPRELIKSRQRVYLPFVEALVTLHQPSSSLDLGCGRGELVELMQEAGFLARGVDLDEDMLAVARAARLDVSNAEALQTLRSVPAESLSVVSALHL